MKAYNGSVRHLLAVIFLSLSAFTSARAGTALIDAGTSPVLNVQMLSGAVTIQTWNRPQIQIDTQGTVHWQHYAADRVAAQIPTQFSILAQSVVTAQGTVMLPAEVWVLPQLPTLPHEGVVLTGNGATTITVPAGTALVAVRITQGSISLQDYNNGAFFTAVHTGSIVLRNVSGSGFAQVVRGPIVAINSSFERLRARTVAGNLFFENVNAHQIKVSSARGSIVYDNGSFQPGLARFESQYGNIALGVASGGAQIGAHSDTGNVISEFNNPRNVTSTTTANDINAHFAGGGATVTASSTRGSVILYDGHISDHPALTQRFPGMKRLQQKFPQNRNVQFKRVLR